MTIPLVVGIDEPESSLEAVDWAADEAVRHGVPLHLLHAAAGDREAFDVISAATAVPGRELPRCGCPARCRTRTRPPPWSARGATPSH